MPPGAPPKSATASRSRRGAASGSTGYGRSTPSAAAGCARSTRSSALAGADCWVTGLRREQSPLRASTLELAWDQRHGLFKAVPLATWSEADVWEYIAAHELPYNRLHDRGYASIGCTHCTVPGHGREGRWANSDKSECGMHGR